jgi:hypothetical protein
LAALQGRLQVGHRQAAELQLRVDTLPGRDGFSQLLQGIRRIRFGHIPSID